MKLIFDLTPEARSLLAPEYPAGSPIRTAFQNDIVELEALQDAKDLQRTAMRVCPGEAVREIRTTIFACELWAKKYKRVYAHLEH